MRKFPKIKFYTYTAIAYCITTCIPAHAITLKDSVIKTINSNPEVVMNIKGWQAAQKGIKLARGGYLPSVDLFANYGLQRTKNSSTNFRFKSPDTYGYGVQARQMIFDGFETTNEVMRNKKLAQADKYKTKSVTDDIALLAVKAYLGVMRTQELVQIAKQNYQTHLRLYRIIRRRTETGLSRKADRSQATGRLALAKSNLLAIQNSYDDVTTTFNRVIGTYPTDLESRILPPPDSMLPKNQQGAIKWAIDNHPALKAAYADVAEAKAQNRVSRAPFYPKIDAVVNASYNRNLSGIKGNYANYQATLEAKYNIFKGGSDFARQQATALLVEQASSMRDRSYRQVVEGTQLSWNALQTAKAQLQYFKQHRDAAIKTVKSYYQQFRIHKRTLLDLLNSENELFKARVDYINGKYNLLFAKFRTLNSGGQLTNYFLPTSKPKKAKS